jgi:hypothetical protein
MQSIRIAPPNSLLFIADSDGGQIPVTDGTARLWSTPSCIVVGCLAEMDGETEVSIGAAEGIDTGGAPTFDGMLTTPSRKVFVSSVEQSVLSATVSGITTRVRIWTNHPTEPDKVVVGLG